MVTELGGGGGERQTDRQKERHRQRETGRDQEKGRVTERKGEEGTYTRTHTHIWSVYIPQLDRPVLISRNL